MPPSYLRDLRAGFKRLSLRNKRDKERDQCTQCESFVYNLNENIWQEWHDGPRKELTFSKDARCYICSNVRRAFAAAHGPRAGDFVEAQAFRLDTVTGEGIYCLWPTGSRMEESTPLYCLPLEVPHGDAPGREVHQRDVDIHLLRKWIRNCEEWHGQECDLGTHQPLDESARIRVIDVIDECLVHVPCTSRYLALSYVWGGVESLQTTKANTHAHEIPGLFSNHPRLPQTILDSMKLVANIGERYLWVDALCIVQDDFENKMNLINQMDKIYQNAVCTIVAAVGTDSTAGLRGLDEQSPRCIPQQVLSYGEGRRIAFSQRPLHRLLGRTKAVVASEGEQEQTEVTNEVVYWNKRAWTHQERLLSGRKLIFLEDGVHFNCQRVTWTEDVNNEREGVNRHFQMYDFEQVSDTDRFFSGHAPAGVKPRKKDEYMLRGARSSLPNFIEYCNLVVSHMSRDLTFEEDVLFSFQGILNNLSHAFGGFTQGFSDFYFSLCLLWQPKTFCRRRNRVKGLTIPEVLDTPSWSWAAWVCEIDLDYWKGACDFLSHNSIDTSFRTFPKVQFATATSTSEVQTIGTFRDSWAEYQAKDYETPEEWNECLSDSWECRELTSHYYRGRQKYCEFLVKDDPSRYFNYPIPLPRDQSRSTITSTKPVQLLSCTTAVASLTISNTIYQYPFRDNAASVVDQDGDLCGCIILHEPIALPDTVQEFVKISHGEVFVGVMQESIFPEAGWVRSKLQGEEFYRYVNVLMTTQKEGVKTRVGIGRIGRDVWEAAGPQTATVLLG